MAIYSSSQVFALTDTQRHTHRESRPTAISRPLNTYTHTHARLTALCPGLPRWAGTRKVKPIWILLKQETLSGSGISWAICKSAPHSRQIATPASHHSVVSIYTINSKYTINSIWQYIIVESCIKTAEQIEVAFGTQTSEYYRTFVVHSKCSSGN